MLLDGSFLGRAAGKFSVEEFAFWKSVFMEMKCFIEMLTSVQSFEGKWMYSEQHSMFCHDTTKSFIQKL